MPTVPPISLSDDQLVQITRCAAPLPPEDRDQFLRRLAELLRGAEIADGAVWRATRETQREVFRTPMFNGGAGVPRWSR